MAKYLLPVAGVLAWSVGLAALSGFDAMDADQDGKITPREHATAAERMFKTMDADRDGKVTAAEMDAAHEKISGEKADKDGSLSKAEFDAGHAALQKKQ